MRDELVKLTCELMEIPSTVDNPDQLWVAIDYAERYARAIPGLFIHRFESNNKPSLMVTLRDTHTPDIILNAHLDVVPAHPEQYVPQVRDGRIYGRGSQDMKGSAAVLLRLMKDLAALPERPDVGFQFVSDEEIGGYHGTNALAEAGWHCKFFLAAEPTDLQICYTHKGGLWTEVLLKGQPAHASRPWDGQNPFAALREGLIELEKRFPTPDEAAWVTTVVPTIITGGDATNRLPKSVQLHLDIRYIPEDKPERIISELRKCFGDEAVQQARAGQPLATDPNDPQVRRLADTIAGVIGAPAAFYREHFATDARFYGSMGVPAVCVGPVGAGLHSDDEWVDIASLEQLYELLRRFVLNR